MSREQFLEKFANEDLYFTSMYNHKTVYKNEEVCIWIEGKVGTGHILLYREVLMDLVMLTGSRFGYIVDGKLEPCTH